MSHNFFPFGKRLQLSVGSPISLRWGRYLKNSEEVIYGKISCYYSWALCEHVLEFGILIGLFSSQFLGIYMGSNVWLGQHTPPTSGGRTPRPTHPIHWGKLSRKSITQKWLHSKYFPFIHPSVEIVIDDSHHLYRQCQIYQLIDRMTVSVIRAGVMYDFINWTFN